MKHQAISRFAMPNVLTLNSLPLLPLKTVLFPAGYLPLQIFEVRYLDLIAQCFKSGAPFGLVTLAKGSEVRHAPTPGAPDEGLGDTLFYPTGTLARVTNLSQPQAGLMLIQCIGLQRFTINRHELLRHGLFTADVTLLPDDQGVQIPPDLLAAAGTLRRVIDTLVAQGTPPDQMPIQQPYRTDDCAWVSNRWCELLPMSLEQKNRLMTLDNPLVRLELVSDLLEQNGIST